MRRWIAIGLVATVSSGCMTTAERVHEVAAADLRCAPNNVIVEFDSRPKVGMTRYAAEGCDKSRTYLCYKRVYVYGLPLGAATCSRERS